MAPAPRAEFVDGVEDRLRHRGYCVMRNRPYAGGFITEHYGKPAAGWHALQIEVSRGLYMDEATLEKNARFEAIARDLAEVVAELARDVHMGEWAASGAPPPNSRALQTAWALELA